MEMDLENLKISQHAKERYAERIMDRDNKADINVFIANNEPKIKNDISKMIEYGQLLFSGKPIDLYNRQPVDIFLNGTWVIIVDIKKVNVVTLYSIDLGVGQDFNNQYINKLLDKLDLAKERLSDTQSKINKQTDTYRELIHENEVAIAEYKKIVKSLEQQNAGYEEIIESIHAGEIIAEKEVRDIVATLIGKKVF